MGNDGVFYSKKEIAQDEIKKINHSFHNLVKLGYVTDYQRTKLYYYLRSKLL